MRWREELNQAAAHGLRLRAWVLQLLAGQAVPAPTGLPAHAWGRFLRAERCALPVRGRTQRLGVALPEEVQVMLEDGATRELQRWLSMQGQLRLVGRLAAEQGLAVVALKGAAFACAGGEPLDVADLDVLARPGDAQRLGAVIDRAGGHRRRGADADAPTPGRYVLGARVAPESVPVEVHFEVPFVGDAVDVWAGVRPGACGVLLLEPADHLWHLLVHSAVHHLVRRGQIRELILLTGAVRACTAADLSRVERHIDGHPARVALDGLLAMARALAAGEPAPDRFERIAAVRHGAAYTARPLRWIPVKTWEAYCTAAVALEAGEGEYRALWHGTERSALVPGRYRGYRFRDRLLPSTLARGLRMALRSANLLVGSALALALRAALRTGGREPLRG